MSVIKLLSGTLPFENWKALNTNTTTVVAAVSGQRYLVHGIQVSGGTGGVVSIATNSRTIWSLDIPANTPVIVPITLQCDFGHDLTLSYSGLTSPLLNLQYSHETQ